MTSLEGEPNIPKNAEEKHESSSKRPLQDAIVEALLSKIIKEESKE
jgi:hypothetical protein